MKNYKDKHIWIIGASSGIGAALAQELSKRGAGLVLSARRKEELDKLKDKLGGDHHVLPLNIADLADFKNAAGKIKEFVPRLDSVVVLAALYEPSALDEIDIEKADRIIDVNLKGSLNAVYTVLPQLKAQGEGQIVLCGSVAGYCGLPRGQIYSATKAAVINLAESLHAEMRGSGIDVKVINPGFVKTPMTDKNDFDMPMMIAPEKAAQNIADGLLSKNFEIHFPKTFTRLMKILASLPYGLYFRLSEKLAQ